MKTFKILVEETVSEEFEIIAQNEDEALKIASQKYKTGELVLAPGELIGTEISVVEQH